MMEEEQLRLLEERINKAIAFIENLKSREKTLIEERENIKRRLSSLEETVREKDLKIDALKENQLFLKDKIEAILSKLESLASLDAETVPFMAEKEGALKGEGFREKVIPDKASLEGGELIVEENIVDLEEEEGDSDENTLFESGEISGDDDAGSGNG